MGSPGQCVGRPVSWLPVRRFASSSLEALSATGDETVRAEPFEAIELALTTIFSG
jgi:hypothetical protein